jgi:hypothetical protein
MQPPPRSIREQRITPMIPIQEFNAALAELDFQSSQWYRARYGETCRMCVDSSAGSQLLLSMLDYMIALQRSGGDFSIPLVMLAGIMFQTGYVMGRRRAEAEILEGWMRL